MHLNCWLDAILDLGELKGCISSILESTLWHIKDLFPNFILEVLSRTLTAWRKGLNFLNWVPLWKIREPNGFQKKNQFHALHWCWKLFCSWRYTILLKKRKQATIDPGTEMNFKTLGLEDSRLTVDIYTILVFLSWLCLSFIDIVVKFV